MHYGLVVDSDTKSRGNLKQAALAVHSFSKVNNASNVREAVEKLNGIEPCDVIFLFLFFGKEEIAKFIATAKGNQKGEDCAYILVLKSSQQDNATVAESVLLGVSGLLFEPYSVDRLKEISDLATKIKNDNSIKEKAALRLLIDNIMQEYDKISLYMSKGLNVDKAKKKFAESCTALKHFQSEEFEIYKEIAIDAFENALPGVTGNYGGASARIKKKMEAKLLEEYEKEMVANQ